MDDLWEDWSDRDFKVALHEINKALEPQRPSRTAPQYIIRQGVSYRLHLEKVWIDVDLLEKYIILGNEALYNDDHIAEKAYKKAIELYQGIYLPNRIYADWSSEEREKTQFLILGAYISLAEIILHQKPLESIRLVEAALAIDNTWEDAYRIQMKSLSYKRKPPPGHQSIYEM